MPIFLELRQAAQGNPELSQQIERILERLKTAESYLSMNLQWLGLGSVKIVGNQHQGVVQLTLDGDADKPGNSYAYMTAPNGSKGWHRVADVISTSPDLTNTVANETGVVTLGLAPVVHAQLQKAETALQKGDALSAPVVTDLIEAPDDPMAAQAGVPVGGIYRTANALQVRLS